MLVLTRKSGEYIDIGGIKVFVVSVKGKKVKLGVEAPIEVPIHRSEHVAQHSDAGPTHERT